MSRSNKTDLVADCDALLKQGRVGDVAKLISEISLAKIPRQMVQPLAKICRRAGLIDQGIRLLHPLVRGANSLAEPASVAETSEYAVLLSRNGSVAEALELLSKVDPAKYPEAALYRAFCHISSWEYGEASAWLERFLASSADEYSKIIARVNLGAAYLATDRLAEAGVLLDETIRIGEASQAPRLVANSLEQKAHFWFRQDEFGKAREALARSAAILGEGGYDRILVEKWKAIMSAIETKNLAPLAVFRQAAVEAKHFESVREADLFSLRVAGNQAVFDHLYFGTPFAGYRQWIRKHVDLEPSGSFVLGSESPTVVMDLETGEVRGGTAGIKSGKKVHQVFAALTRDFYVPRNMGSLFHELYPSEHYDIDSSPGRVRQAIHRARKWLEACGSPANIEFVNGSYAFAIVSSFGLKVPLERGSFEANEARWKLVLSQMKSPEFSAAEVEKALSLSRTSVLQLMQWAIDGGRAERFGAEKQTRYRLTGVSVRDGDSKRLSRTG